MKKVFLAFILLFSFAFSGCGWIAGWTSNGLSAAHKEFDPSAMLRKYEWFKDQYAQMQQISKRTEDAESRIKRFESFNGAPSKWGWQTHDEYNRLGTVLQGYKDQYNSLAAEYNSQSSKFNWKKFKGEVPQAIEEYR